MVNDINRIVQNANLLNSMTANNQLINGARGISIPSFGMNMSPATPAFRNNLLTAQRNADTMRSVINSMRGVGRGNTSPFGITRATSENEEILQITSSDANRLRNANLQNFTVDVIQTAAAQRNEGSGLAASDLAADSGFDVGNHHIQLNVGGRQFDINFTVSDTDTVRDVQQRVANAINARTTTGVQASVNFNSDTGESSLVLQSAQTGVDRSGMPNFTLNSNAGNALDVLGINNITQEARNAEFRVNRGFTGALHTSRSNDVDLGHGIQARLESEGRADIRMGRDTNAQLGSFRELVNSFNEFLRSARDQSGLVRNRLETDLTRLAITSSASLARIGISRDRDGFMQIDERRMTQAAESGALERFAMDGGRSGNFGFVNRLRLLADNVSRNPVRFVNSRDLTQQQRMPQHLPNWFINSGLLFESMM